MRFLICFLFSLSAHAAYFGSPLPVLHGGTQTANRTLVNSSSDLTVDWENSLLKVGPNTSINWVNRFLADNTGTLTLDYSSKADLYLTAQPMTTKGDLSVRATSTVNRLPVGTNGQVLTADSAETVGVKWANPASAPLPPQIDVFTAGMSGTYTVCASPVYLEIEMIGAGGSGGGGGAGGTVGSDGADTVFDALTAEGGVTGGYDVMGGAGGSFTIGGGFTGFGFRGGDGGASNGTSSIIVGAGGSSGGSGFFGGSGTGGNPNAGTGAAGAANSGAGGGGGGSGGGTPASSGSGGGSGGYIHAYLTTGIGASYSYSVGAGGTAAGTGNPGGNGAGGILIVKAYCL